MEDNADVTDALRILFEHNGYRVSVAANVAEAVQVGLSDPPKITLLDISLGKGEDGLDILRRWRKEGIAPGRVLALTGHADEATQQRCAEAGCEAVLLKPVPTAELLATVAGVR